MTQTIGKILAVVCIATLAGCSSNKHGTTVAYDSGYTTTSHGYVATSYDDTYNTPAYDRGSVVVNDVDSTPYPPAPVTTQTTKSTTVTTPRTTYQNTTVQPEPGTTTTYTPPRTTHQSTTVQTEPRTATTYTPPRDTVYTTPRNTNQNNTQVRPVNMRTSRGEVTLDEFRQHVNNQSAIVVDAREPKHFSKGHVRGAINIPAGDEDAYMAKFRKDVPPDQLVIVYCGGPDCPAGDNVAKYLSSQGYTNLRVYHPGWQELSKTDLD